MNVLHTVAGLWETTGGPAASVPGLCRALGRRGHRVTLLTGAGALAPEVTRAAREISVETVRLGPYSAANFSFEFGRACRRAIELCDLIHTHGLWLHPNWASAGAARKAGKPLVISPRGMLEEWSLARSRWRKRLLWDLRERRSFARAALIHATSSGEAGSVRAMGVETPIAVVPNGIDLEGEFRSDYLDSIGSGAARSKATYGPTVLFMARIHPKKGLDLLLDAWTGLSASRRPARLILCGGGEPAHVAALEKRLADLGDDGIEYLGPVAGERKLELLLGAEVVVLPSLSENYGMVVAEALACRTPVITTTATPWRAIAERGCGWWVKANVGDLTAALDTALGLGESDRAEMGERGRALIERDHSLGRSAEMMEAAYLWLLDRHEKPDWVHDRVAA